MKKYLFAIVLMLAVNACVNKPASGDKGPEFCTVQGTIKGVKNGTKLELQDSWNHFEVIATTEVEDGTFEFHPHITEPTHVYLYTKSGKQLKDFFLEPGTIVTDVDADDEEDYALGATGTVSNDTMKKIRDLYHSDDKQTADSLKNEVLNAEQTGPLALYYASNAGCSAAKGLSVLDRLSSDLAGKPYLAELREELTRRMKTEPRVEGSDFVPTFIDMEYADANGKAISLSSVVHNPANRYVLVDFWATWCGPCRQSIPLLKELYAKYHAKGFEIYSLSEDEDAKGWKSFIAKNGMTWINVLDDQPGRKNSKAWHNYALNGIPTFVLIDCKTGEIIARDNSDELDVTLAKLLNGTD
ncbi:MAG: AhpC/TSA family protein [Prevotella sp.]|nr:AhpC/TSA family protein [Prevotella sp.]